MMSQILQVTCPKCSARLSIQRPAAERASITCAKCSHPFVVKVPPAPLAPAGPDMGDLSNLDLPSSPLPSSPATPSAFATSPRPGGPAKKRTGKRQRSATPIVIGASVVAGIVVLGIGSWLFMQNGGGKMLGGVLPGTVFDSADAVLSQANQNDEELIRLASELSTGKVTELRDEFISSLERSRKLVFRSVKVAPLSESEADALFAEVGVSEGPLDSDAIETLVEQVQELTDGKDKAVIRLSVTQASANTKFVREYLRHGHLKLPDADAEGERIARERIEILREFNRLLASRVEKSEAKMKTAMEKEKARLGGEMPEGPPPEKTQQEIAAEIDKVFGPIADEVQSFADRLTKLAEQRYGLEKAEVGDEKQYDELFFYALAANGRVFNRLGLTRGEESSFVKAFKNLMVSIQDHERAVRGSAPSKIAALEREKEEAERREQERQDKIAAEKREQDARIAREKAAEEERKRQMAMSDNAQESAPVNDLAMDESMGNPGAGSPFGPSGGPGSRFRGSFGPGSRFGNRGSGFPGGPNGIGPRGGRGSGSSGPPPIDTKTGFTITMKDADGVSSRDISKKLLTLKSAVSVRISGGQLTVQGGYTGALSDVTKLIDFGKVVSVDDKTRTIVVERE